MPKKTDGAQALLGDVAYNAVREAIQEGNFKSGDRISEYKIAEWLGISRTPAREALQRLENEGLLTAHPRRGLVVASIDDDAFDQLYAVRELLEGAAAAMAAKNATEAEIAKLGQLVESQATHVDDPEQMYAYNRVIRDTIYSACRNKFLQKFLTITSDTLSAYRDVSTMVVEERRKQVITEHRELLDAIARRDEAGARAAATNHVRNALRMRMKVRHDDMIRTLLEQGVPNPPTKRPVSVP
jgi:DNA-binding GntR family transcriptional regulator